MLTLDGSQGEGGGQILRSALGLSLVTGTPFRIDNIRAGREKPGLLRQHLTAVQAATELGKAEVRGASIGSTVLTFTPHGIHPGSYHFAVGSAGSATLVFQTVLPALLAAAAGRTTLTLEGGTHNSWAPPYDFLERSFLPLLSRMGARVSCKLERRGFYPAGGGRFTVDVQPGTLSRLGLTERGKPVARRATAVVSKLTADIARRELKTLARKLEIQPNQQTVVEDATSPGPGNAVWVEVASEHVTELFTGFGEKRVSAEEVANRLEKEVRAYLECGAPVGEYLADQLLLPLALAGGGSFVASPLSLHSTTNMDVISMFLPRKFHVDRSKEKVHRVDVD